MKIAVLGVNEAALVALDAISSRGDHEAVLVVPWLTSVATPLVVTPSPLNELNFGYPGVDDISVGFHIQGNMDWRVERPHLFKAGLMAFQGIKPMASNYRIFEHLKPMLNTVTNVIWAPGEIMLRDLLESSVGGVDAIINVHDRADMCGVDDHTFIKTRMWWSTEKGPKVGGGNVLYNTAEAPSWAITSNIHGRNVTIWDQPPPYDDIHEYDMPTKMTCSCETPGIDLHVGRDATYVPLGLSRAYEQVVEFLHHPLSRINNEDTVSN